MFQCKDLLSLTTMSQADVIAGSGGMEKGIRWSYKAENINFPLFTIPSENVRTGLRVTSMQKKFGRDMQ